jgi:hypothetical protein
MENASLAYHKLTIDTILIHSIIQTRVEKPVTKRIQGYDNAPLLSSILVSTGLAGLPHKINSSRVSFPMSSLSDADIK